MSGFIDVCYDMETGDPDDVVSLIMLFSHPKVIVRSVTVFPGGKDQLGFVRWLTRLLADTRKDDRHKVKIGGYLDFSQSPQKKKYLSAGIVKLFPEYQPTEDSGDGAGHEVLAETINAHGPRTLVITGAPLSNVKGLFENHPEVKLDLLVCQGGFAGDAVVPEQHRLTKFAGHNEVSTWNLGGDIPAAKFVLASSAITKRIFVSKNVCHGVTYTNALHEQLREASEKNASLQILFKMMDTYMKKHPSKAMHDPLACCVALNPDIVELVEVDLYHVAKGNAWGSRAAEATRTWISVAMKDSKLFYATFTGQA